MTIKEEYYGRGHVQNAATLVNLAGVYSELGDAMRGRELLELSLSIEEQHFGVGHVETAVTLNNLALACGETGDIYRMRTFLERSLTIKDRHFGVNHLESCLILVNLGMTFGAMHEHGAARSFSGRALSTCRAPGAPSSRRVAVVFLRAAAVHFAVDEVDAAEELAQVALRMFVQVLGDAASARVLFLERTRTSRIWHAVGRDDVARWLTGGMADSKPSKPRPPPVAGIVT